MKQNREPTLGGYPVVGGVVLPDNIQKADGSTDDPLFVKVEGVQAILATNMGKSRDGKTTYVKLYGNEENIQGFNILDPIIGVPSEKVKPEQHQ